MPADDLGETPLPASDVHADEERLRISGGIAELQHGDTAASLFERADGALYRAKELGKDRASVATE